MFTPHDRRRLISIEAMLMALLAKEREQMATIQDVEDAVADLTVAVDAAVAAIGSVSGVTPQQLDKVAADIKAQTNKLTTALSAKTEEAHAAGM